jgi:signal transduction histidine kinase
MREYCRKLVILTLVLFSGNLLLAHDAIHLSNRTNREEALAKQISVFEDLTGKLKFDNIVNFKFDSTSYIIANNRNRNTAYWLKFDLDVEEDITQKKLFEILDFKIDSFELYLPEPTGGYRIFKGGDAYPFSFRNYSHKNFIYDLPYYKKGRYSGFIRIKANEVVGLNFAISDLHGFLKYSNNEYLILSLFYGVVTSMALLSLFLYVYLYEKSYLLYSFYILSLGLYFLTRDGLGFQYLWPLLPDLNNYSKPISVLLVVVFHLFFVKYYLNPQSYFPSFDKVMCGLLVAFPILAYIADSWLEILPDPLIAVSILFIPLFVFVLKLALRGDIQARFFVLAYSIQFLGFFVFILSYTDIIDKGPFLFYSINIASAIEIIVFSLALAGKVKQLMKEKEEIKDLANKMLEEKVQSRTRELQERNQQLDVFVYKASHDIKGPLRSMIGLTNLALSDVKDEKAKEYFEYMLQTSSKLDNMVGELLRMGKVKDLEVKYSEVNPHKMIHEIISTLKHIPGFEKMRIVVDISQGYILKTDETLIYSVFQNIIENAIKYMDALKTDPFLNIKLREEDNMIRLDFEDNGLGIPVDTKEKIFDMFYKVNNNSSGTGLGLYLTKLTIEKLGGNIELYSQEKKGTTFVIHFGKIV